MPANTNTPPSSIGIIGVGQVGGAAANALILGSIADEILLVDIKAGLRDAQVRDLSDVAYSIQSKTRVRAASHYEAGQCDIVVIATGAHMFLGETSCLTTFQNVSIIRSVMSATVPFRPDTIVLVVASPVDLVTTLIREMSGLPDSQVIGVGTFVDSVRLRGLVAGVTGIAANSIDLYVVGVHGPSQVTAWSNATIGGIPLARSLPADMIERKKLDKECRTRSQTIVNGKGTTPLGIGSIVSSVCSSILSNKRDVRPISCFQPDFGCCFSLPVVLGRTGVVRTLRMPLDEEERNQLVESVTALKKDVQKIQEGSES